MATRGRPVRWTEREYFRLWEYVTFYRDEARKAFGLPKLSVRCACEGILKREPWGGTGLSAETLRRRFHIASQMRAAGKLGYEWTDETTFDDILNWDMTFILGLDERRMLLGPVRFRAEEEAYEREMIEVQDALAAERDRTHQGGRRGA